MNENLSQEEKDLMMEFFGEIVPRKDLDEYLDWVDEQRRLEEETLRDALPY